MPETAAIVGLIIVGLALAWILLDTRHHEAEMEKLMARIEKAQQATRDQHQDATIEFLHEQLSQLEGVTVDQSGGNHTSSYFAGYSDGQTEKLFGGES